MRLIQTTFILQRAEFNKAHRAVLRNLPTKLRLTGWLQCGLFIALFILPLAYRPDGELQPFSLLISSLVWLTFLLAQITSRALMNLQFKRMDGKEIRYEFDETGFKSSMPDAESHIKWAAINGFLETDKLLVLPYGILFYTVPKRALSGDDLKVLRDLLTEKLQPRQS